MNQSTSPLRLINWTVGTLLVGMSGYTPPDSIRLDDDRKMWINADAMVLRPVGGKYTKVHIYRQAEYVLVEEGTLTEESYRIGTADPSSDLPVELVSELPPEPEQD